MKMGPGFLIFLCWPFFSAHAQFFLQGKLTNQETGKGIPLAHIFITHSFQGTTTDEEGRFFIKIDKELKKEKLKISGFGFYNKIFSIDSLSKVNQKEITLSLMPFHIQPNISIDDPKKIIATAFSQIPENYYQTPFNMEFYSSMEVKTGSDTEYAIETILLTYRRGYISGVENWSKILQTRERGESPLPPIRDQNTKKEYFPFFPSYDIAALDQIGSNKEIPGINIYNPEKFDEMEIKISGQTLFDEDTLWIIDYTLKRDSKFNGTLYISSGNFAILKNKIQLRSASSEIMYKKIDGHYFPYSLKSERPYPIGNTSYSIVHHVILKNINPIRVEVITQGSKNIYAEDVPYNQNYWDLYYPKQP